MELNRTLISVPNTLFIIFFLYIFLLFTVFGKIKAHLGHSGGLSPILRRGEYLFCCLWQSIHNFVFIPLVVFLPC